MRDVVSVANAPTKKQSESSLRVWRWRDALFLTTVLEAKIPSVRKIGLLKQVPKSLPKNLVPKSALKLHDVGQNSRNLFNNTLLGADISIQDTNSM